ncbi:DUF5320 domain-containing protein [Candidatus Micrarchaeota archaeon]|nr:DUF5320 domain-containing protein [Candidatus Micrarchaeota archaeon]
MPGGDGTGPRWACGRWNCRKGIGFGRRGCFGRNIRSSQDELGDLKTYATELKAELEGVSKRIGELEEK